jgi:hypothetical protein
VAKSCPPVLNRRVKNRRRGWSPELILFRFTVSSLQPRVVGSFSDTWCMVPQPFIAGRNRSYPRFYLGRNRRPTVPGENYPDSLFGWFEMVISFDANYVESIWFNQ